MQDQKRFCRNCGDITSHYYNMPPIVLNLVLSICTYGLWLFVWFIWYINAHNERADGNNFICAGCNKINPLPAGFTNYHSTDKFKKVFNVE